MNVSTLVRELDEGDGVPRDELTNHVEEASLRDAIRIGSVYPVGDRIKATRRDVEAIDE